MKYKALFLFFITFTSMQVYCQTNFKYVTAKLVFAKPILTKLTNTTSITPLYSITPAMLVAPTFYCNNLGFFCKQEIKLQKVIKFPFKFRIGSVQEVDYLEGKRNTYFFGR
jgi:hypothetical protein